ncbi:glycosyltransferase family 4 protein [Cumulibacter manganitolerans]|uniref:glycosyltransferase family 4 protein n=1 Tax=Cumulibacter manganitolerans TaxID=1884992 RepID=UPI00129540F5|nr:glycosyltransferase family 4 protein [Cumulibacter manganitolerans]
MRTPPTGFARWRSDVPSGGNRYDEELVAGLHRLGVPLREYAVTGPWPLPGPDDRRRLDAVLGAERNWLLNNIVGSAAPDAIKAAVAAGARVTLLMHYFPADDPALPAPDRARLAVTEADAVATSGAVVVTSGWAAAEVARRYGRDDAVVAPPGVDAAAPAPGSVARGRAPTLLWLGSLTPTKDPLTFVAALARLRALEWTALIVGPDAAHPMLTQQVRRRIDDAGLAGRIRLLGPRTGAALDDVWDGADLLVHTSWFETYGMVVAEALARGIPSIVASGTGAVEAQGPGGTFPPGDDAALAAALRGWLEDADQRGRWRAGALRDRMRLPGWEATARIVASALSG